MDELLTIRKLQKQVHALAREKGWWDGVDLACPRTLASMLMNAACELAEAQEENRSHGVDGLKVRYGKGGKPEGGAIELADAIIRCLDTLAGYGYDAERLIEIKTEFNRTRSHKHGKLL